jgi:isopenicillin-N N-acyltransferase-like protein
MILSEQSSLGLPHIIVSGSPYERGRSYGEAARGRIAHTRAMYEKVFLHRAGLEWREAVRRALAYESAIGEFSPASLDELRGLAKGAELAWGDVMAINARSELMYASASGPSAATVLAGECTSFAVLPEASANRHTLLGQNWDWLPFALDTAVVLEVHRDDFPSYITIAEAGHFAKVGFNAAGLGMCTNTLVSTRDMGVIGVPYHSVLRALMDATTLSSAVRTVYAMPRALSANYLLAHAQGQAVNIETTSGGASGVHPSMPENGILTHANHFLAPEFSREDARVAQQPDSLFRNDIMRRGLAAAGGAVSLADTQAILRDHRNLPEAVCSHPSPDKHPLESRTSVISVVADLDAGEFWMTRGPPCLSDYRPFQFAARLNRP